MGNSIRKKKPFSAIKSLGGDYIYADTDSVKFLNLNKHKEYFEKYNKNIKEKLIKAVNERNLSEDLLHPKTIEGKEKWLGVWDDEGTYAYFKTLGAKRYMVLNNDNSLSITVSGLNKNITVPYILRECGISFTKKGSKCIISNRLDYKKAFDFFDNDMFIPSEYTGKNVHAYIDYQIKGIVQDYKGNYYKYNELSAIHLEPTFYRMSVVSDAINFIMGVETNIR